MILLPKSGAGVLFLHQLRNQDIHFGCSFSITQNQTLSPAMNSPAVLWPKNYRTSSKDQWHSLWNICIAFPFVSYPQSCNFLQILVFHSWFSLLMLFHVVSLVLPGRNWCLPVGRLVHVCKHCLSGMGIGIWYLNVLWWISPPFLITIKCTNLYFKILLSTFSMCMLVLVL